MNFNELKMRITQITNESMLVFDPILALLGPK